MTGLLVVMGAGFGFGMFLWGQLVTRAACRERDEREWLDGFRAGWEAAEQFDNDVRLIWGGTR
jgi:hypothetical protein